MKRFDATALSDRELERRVRDMDERVRLAYERAESAEREYQELLAERQRRLCSPRQKGA